MQVIISRLAISILVVGCADAYAVGERTSEIPVKNIVLSGDSDGYLIVAARGKTFAVYAANGELTRAEILVTDDLQPLITPGSSRDYLVYQTVKPPVLRSFLKTREAATATPLQDLVGKTTTPYCVLPREQILFAETSCLLPNPTLDDLGIKLETLVGPRLVSRASWVLAQDDVIEYGFVPGKARGFVTPFGSLVGCVTCAYPKKFLSVFQLSPLEEVASLQIGSITTDSYPVGLDKGCGSGSNLTVLEWDNDPGTLRVLGITLGKENGAWKSSLKEFATFSLDVPVEMNQACVRGRRVFYLGHDGQMGVVIMGETRSLRWKIPDAYRFEVNPEGNRVIAFGDRGATVWNVGENEATLDELVSRRLMGLLSVEGVK